MAATDAGPQSVLSAAAAQAESAPPETSTTPLERGSRRPPASTTSARASIAGELCTRPMIGRRSPGFSASSPTTRPRRGGREELGRLGESLQRDLADRLEVQILVRADLVDDGAGDEDLPGEGSRGDPVGEVDVAAEVVAVAVDRVAEVHAGPRADRKSVV